MLAAVQTVLRIPPQLFADEVSLCNKQHEVLQSLCKQFLIECSMIVMYTILQATQIVVLNIECEKSLEIVRDRKTVFISISLAEQRVIDDFPLGWTKNCSAILLR